MTSTGDMFRFTASDGTTLNAYRWGDPPTARAAVRVAHGMGEHARRYEHLADTLTAHGHVVHAQDRRGHGSNVTSEAELGQIGADRWRALVADIGALTDTVEREAPGLPVAVLRWTTSPTYTTLKMFSHSEEAQESIAAFNGKHKPDFSKYRSN